VRRQDHALWIHSQQWVIGRGRLLHEYVERCAKDPVFLKRTSLGRRALIVEWVQQLDWIRNIDRGHAGNSF